MNCESGWANAHRSTKLVTDIDVLGIRPSGNLQWEVLLGDCKTLKGQSPANRVVWLNGLMSLYRASEGFVVLQRRASQPIEPDHKLFASSMNIFLLDEKDFTTFNRSLIFPEGSASFGYQATEFTQMWSVRTRFPGLGSLVEFLSSAAWESPEFTLLMRRSLGEGKASSREIDPAKSEHIAMVLNLSAVFSIGLAACSGAVFHRLIHPKSEIELSDALKTIIWGGKANYRFFSDLRSQLLEAKGRPNVEPDNLSLPQWPRFVQLTRKTLENPRATFQVPSLLQLASLDVSQGREILPHFDRNAEQGLVLAMVVVDYVVRACGMPEEVRKVVESHFVKRLSKAVHAPA